MKKIIFMLISACLLLVLNLSSTQVRKAVVVADKANIYAEPNSRSYLIETVNKGTILTLFQAGKIRNEWYYVTFRSSKKNCKVSGFVHSLLIEFFEGSKRDLQFEANLKADSRKKRDNLSLKKKNALLIEKKKDQKTFLDKMTVLPTSLFKREFVSLDPAPHTLARTFPSLKSFTQKKESYQNIIATALPSLRLHLNKLPFAFREGNQLVFRRAVKSPGEIEVNRFFKTAKKDEKNKIQTKLIEVSLDCNQKTPLETKENLFKDLKIPAFSEDEDAFFLKIVDFPQALERRELTSLKARNYFRARPFLALRAANQEKEVIEKETKILPSSSGLVEHFSAEKFKEEKDFSPFPQNRKRGKKANQPIIQKKLHPFAVKINKKKYYPFSLGIGYGQSQGGLGIFIQFNTKRGISIHGGAGYYPSSFIYSSSNWVKSVVLFSGGIKYYLPLKMDPIAFYFDLQLGGLGVEAAQIFKEIWYYSFVYDYRQKTLWGVAILSGAELRLGRVGLNGALGLAHNLNRVEWLQQNIFLTIDFGFLFYF